VVLVIIFVVIALLLFQKKEEPIPQPLPPASIEDVQGQLETAVEEAAQAPDFTTPTANPVNKAVPKVNSIREANPFSNVYQNPFE